MSHYVLSEVSFRGGKGSRRRVDKTLLSRQILVRAVAERGIRGLFALAPPDGLFLGDLVLHRLQAGALVRAVAKRRVA